jgi:hypothetical protein
VTQPDAISAKAHARAARVKATSAAGRSQNRIREQLGIALLPPTVES